MRQSREQREANKVANRAIIEEGRYLGSVFVTPEGNIFNFNGDLYGKNLRIYVKKWLRAEQKFNGLDGLKEQLEKDKKEAAKV